MGRQVATMWWSGISSNLSYSWPHEGFTVTVFVTVEFAMHDNAADRKQFCPHYKKNAHLKTNALREGVDINNITTIDFHHLQNKKKHYFLPFTSTHTYTRTSFFIQLTLSNFMSVSS